MTALKAAVVLGFALAAASTPALACDDACKAGEIYSDDAEMCVPAPPS